MPVRSDDRTDSTEHQQTGLPLTGPARTVLAGSAVTVLAVLAVVTASFVADHRTAPADAPTPAATAPVAAPTTAAATPVPPPAQPVAAARPLRPVRSGTVDSDWQNWSWAATVSAAGRAPDGTRAVPVTFTDGYAGMSLRQGTATRPGPAAVLRARVWVEGAATWLGLTLQVDDNNSGRHSRDQQVPGGRWVTLSVPVGSLGAPPAVKRLTLEHRSAELHGAHRAVRIWVSDFSLS